MHKSLLSPSVLLRVEGGVMFASAVAAYAALRQPALLLALLLFVPDLSMLGYRGGSRLGAAVYNSVHTLLPAAVVIALGAAVNVPAVLAVGLIWAAHIGMDRALGYGLKYPANFKDTHLGRV